MEFGPYIYQETDTFDNLTWSKLQNPVTGEINDAVFAVFNQKTNYSESGDAYLDTPMWLVNQAGLGVWWGQNFAPKWRVVITLFYSLVLDGMGTQVQETGVFGQMRTTEFKSDTKINSEFVRLNPITDQAVVTALYTDPWYGLNNDANYL